MWVERKKTLNSANRDRDNSREKSPNPLSQINSKDVEKTYNNSFISDRQN